jgi:hypothetical protein
VPDPEIGAYTFGVTDATYQGVQDFIDTLNPAHGDRLTIETFGFPDDENRIFKPVLERTLETLVSRSNFARIGDDYSLDTILAEGRRTRALTTFSYGKGYAQRQGVPWAIADISAEEAQEWQEMSSELPLIGRLALMLEALEPDESLEGHYRESRMIHRLGTMAVDMRQTIDLASGSKPALGFIIGSGHGRSLSRKLKHLDVPFSANAPLAGHYIGRARNFALYMGGA